MKLAGPSCILAAAIISHASGQPGKVATIDVTVMVVDDLHRSVAGLTLTDFVVTVDGATIQPLSAAVRRAPLAIALVIDRSASMGGTMASGVPRTGWTNTIIKGVLPALNPRDQLRVAQFGDGISVSLPIAPTRDALRDAAQVIDRVDRTPTLRPSPIWDAVDLAARALRSSALGRLIVLVTDGRVTASRLSVEEAAEVVAAAGVAVTVVDKGAPERVRQDGAGAAAIRADHALAWISEVTGGLYLGGSQGSGRDDDGKLMGAAVTTMRDAYLITLPAPADNKPHALSIRSTRPGVVVRAAKVLLKR